MLIVAGTDSQASGQASSSERPREGGDRLTGATVYREGAAPSALDPSSGTAGAPCHTFNQDYPHSGEGLRIHLYHLCHHRQAVILLGYQGNPYCLLEEPGGGPGAQETRDQSMKWTLLDKEGARLDGTRSLECDTSALGVGKIGIQHGHSCHPNKPPAGDYFPHPTVRPALPPRTPADADSSSRAAHPP